MIPRHTLPLVLLFLSCVAPGFQANANTNTPPRIPDRYLLVVDVSYPMRSRADAVQEAITGLLVSGMGGEIQNGDQLGLWTFNDEMHAGEFDLVVWHDNARNDIIRGVVEFLDKQRFTRKTDFSTVMPDLMGVVAESKRITVILFSDGDEAIQGTPFDEAIADYFWQNKDALKKKRTPFRTILRGYEGTLIGHTISAPSSPVEFPPFPPEPEPEPEPEPVVAETPPVRTQPDLSKTLLTTNTGPIVFAEPLIVSGGSRKKTPPSTEQLESGEPTPSQDTGTNIPSGIIEGSLPAAINTLHAQSTTQSATGTLPPEQMAGTASSEDEPGGRSGFWSPATVLGAVVLGLGAVLGGALLLRRARPSQHASLITKSMDKKDGHE